MLLLIVYPSGATASRPAVEPSAQSLPGNLTASSSTQDSWYYCYYWDYSWCYPYYYHYWSYPYHTNYWWSYPYYTSYYWSSYPYNYYPTTTYQKTKTFDLDVETNPARIVPVNGNGTYNDGTVASFSVSSLIAPLNANQRYVFSYWSEDFSGTSPSGTVTMTSAKRVVANYELQNFLKVSVEPAGIASATGEGWHSPTASVVVGPLPSLVSGGDGTRYVLQQWMVDSTPVSGNSIGITMDTPHTIVAHYKTQYLLTASSDYGIVGGGGWYDAGSTATLSVATEVETGYGVKQVFQKWTGDIESTIATSAIKMDSPHTLMAVWKTDSTILYATIVLGICAAFVLGIGLVMFAVARLKAPKRAAVPPPRPVARPVATVQPVPERLKLAPTKKKARAPPKTRRSEPSPES
jgi:hypothetical protein